MRAVPGVSNSVGVATHLHRAQGSVEPTETLEFFLRALCDLPWHCPGECVAEEPAALFLSQDKDSFTRPGATTIQPGVPNIKNNMSF